VAEGLPRELPEQRHPLRQEQPLEPRVQPLEPRVQPLESRERQGQLLEPRVLQELRERHELPGRQAQAPRGVAAQFARSPCSKRRAPIRSTARAGSFSSLVPPHFSLLK
jgi:hypothetical protein